MERPIVSVICLCYNHAPFVIQAIQSVVDQTYKPIEIIVVDDASTDKSADIIREFCAAHPEIKFIEIRNNLGNCKAFNKGLAEAKGEFIIDLATDDILLPTRVEKGVKAFREYGEEYGIHFCDAECVDKHRNRLWIHSEKIGMRSPPVGDVYKELITRYFISAPTIMSRKIVFESLRGYDESLAFEDFDFWVRSARSFKYCYSAEVLVQKRILAGSKSAAQYRMGSPQMRSIFVVCNKIFDMNKSVQEMRALRTRARYELRQAIRTFNIQLAFDYTRLLRKINMKISQDTFPMES
jgi:glycosyltransferase involved in cell wall biosynthesis